MSLFNDFTALRICSFSSSYVSLNWISLCFSLLHIQNKQYEGKCDASIAISVSNESIRD